MGRGRRGVGVVVSRGLLDLEMIGHDEWIV